MIYAVNNTTKEHRVITGEAGEVDDWRRKMQGWNVVKADADGWIEWSGHADNPLPEHSAVSYHDGGAACRSIAQLAPWSHIIAYRPIIDQPASEEAQPWEPAAGEPARTSGGDCMVLAIDRKRNRAAIRWDDGELGVVKIEVIKQRTTPREQWLAAAEHAIESTTGEPAQSSHLEIIHDALASGELPTPEQTK
ncbi:MAG: hypothetical protein CMH22_16020 [Methylophaga sp.]|nr:hypothetical protein [Methylophaga sp.]MAX53483.1 hypothetical protein [Methylophaga sp.]|tara:strand:- start:30960 stop:31538 length:579 start_codon:yes stop_codon:yes gene_type:complete